MAKVSKNNYFKQHPKAEGDTKLLEFFGLLYSEDLRIKRELREKNEMHKEGPAVTSWKE
jgi:hypothetical protein